MQKSPKNKILPAFIIIIFSFLGINVVSAQVNAYSFSQSYAGYTALTGTPSVAYTSPWDDHTSGAAFQATIPFTFTFDNLPYTQCFISPNGYITFGTTQPVPTTYASIANNTNHMELLRHLIVTLFLMVLILFMMLLVWRQIEHL